jgi:hypothetical protein
MSRRTRQQYKQALENSKPYTGPEGEGKPSPVTRLTKSGPRVCYWTVTQGDQCVVILARNHPDAVAQVKKAFAVPKGQPLPDDITIKCGVPVAPQPASA